MSNKRIRFEAILCCSADRVTLAEAASDIIGELAGKYGGATWIPCNGGWSDHGNDYVREYVSINHENGFMVMLSVLPELVEEAYGDLTKAFSGAIASHGLNARFVHIDQYEVAARHFDVAAGKMLSFLAPA